MKTFFSVSEAEKNQALADQRNLFAERRAEILRTEVFYSAKDWAEKRGAGMKHPAQNAHNLRKKGRIFGIFHDGRYIYPAFQFRDADLRPLKVVGELISQIPPESREWPLLLWLCSASNELSGEKPKEFLSDLVDGTRRSQLFAAAGNAFSSALA